MDRNVQVERRCTLTDTLNQLVAVINCVSQSFKNAFDIITLIAPDQYSDRP